MGWHATGSTLHRPTLILTLNYNFLILSLSSSPDVQASTSIIVRCAYCQCIPVSPLHLPTSTFWRCSHPLPCSSPPAALHSLSYDDLPSFRLLYFSYDLFLSISNVFCFINYDNSPDPDPDPGPVSISPSLTLAHRSP